MKRFVEIFRGYPNDVQANINAIARKRNLTIVSVSTCVNQGIFYATVVYEEGRQ